MVSRFQLQAVACLVAACWSAAFAQVPRLDPALEPALSSDAPVSVFIAGSLQNQQQVARRSLRVPPGARAASSQIVAYRRNLASELRREVRPQQERLTQVLSQLGATKLQPFPLFNLIAAQIPGTAIPALLASPDVLFIEKPAEYRALSPVDVEAIRAPVFWSSGFTGEGVPIAILDTGIRATHLAFAGKEVFSYAFVDDFRELPCLADNVDDPDDYNGHGTHVAAIAAGRWHENFSGVAHGVGAIYSYKVGVRTAEGPGGCRDGGPFSTLGIYTALAHIVEFTPVQTVNMSFGSVGGNYNHRQSAFVDLLAESFGVSFVIAAGNSGPGNPPGKVFPVGSPGVTANGITVANVDTRATGDRSYHSINPSSSRGPAFDGGHKPDLAAPGTDYLSASITSDQSLIRLTGTSMAAPAVAGAVALLRSAGVTDWREIKAVLINSATNQSLFNSFLGRYWDEAWGHGYTNLQRAYAWKDFRLSSELPPASPAALWRIPHAQGYFAATLVNQRQFTAELAPYTNDLALSVFSASSGHRLDVSTDPNQVVQLVDTYADGDLIVQVAAQDPSLFRQRNSPEPFALALSTGGATRVAPPSLSLNCTAPPTVRVSTSFDVNCALTNRGELSIFSPRFVIPNGPSTAAASPLAPSATMRTTFRLTAPSASQPLTLRVQATGNAYGFTYSPEQTLAINIEPNASLPQVGISVNELNITATVGVDPSPQQIVLSTTGAGVSFGASSPASWLTLSSSTNYAPTNLRVTIQSRNLSAGTYTTRITIALAGAATSSLVVPVTLRVNPAVTAPTTTFKDFTIGKSVVSTSCVQPTAALNFTPQDTSVWMWFQSNQARRGDIVRFLWTAPSGSNYATQTEPALTSDGNFCRWQRLLLPPSPAAEHLGIWSVQVSYNGATIHTGYFIYSKVTLVGAAMTRSIPSGAGCPTPAANSVFSRSDQQAVAWFLVSGAAAGDRASIRWITPAGTTHSTSSFSSIPSAGSWCHNAALPLRDAQPGVWTAVWLWNNATIYYERFTITN